MAPPAGSGADGDGSGEEHAAATAVLVVNPSAFARACTVAGLETSSDVAVEAYPAINAADRASPPDVIVFQTAERHFDASPLSRQLALAARRWPRTPALVIADFADADEMIATIQAGAQGLLPSTASVSSMHCAIRLLVEGIAVHPVSLIPALRPAAPRLPATPAHAGPDGAGRRMAALTTRQQEVLQLLVLGSSNKTIAQQLRISESTVKLHIRAIMAQNDASNRTQLVAHFLKGNDPEQ